MAHDSRSKRKLRRVKRERTLLRRAVGYQEQQLQTVGRKLMEAQAELRELKPAPSYTIKTLPDADEAEAIGNSEAIGYIDPNSIDTVLPNHPEFVTEDLNRECCIDDSSASE